MPKSALVLDYATINKTCCFILPLLLEALYLTTASFLVPVFLFILPDFSEPASLVLLAARQLATDPMPVLSS